MSQLDLQMYDFLILPIRHKDIQEGNEFVKRFLIGGQTVWETIWDKIESVKNLWSVTECPDAYLTYLKQIVGWTPDLDNITSGLDIVSLRRLIAASVPLWKSRSKEDSIVDILNLVTANRSRIWNWFDFRWVIDETYFDEQRQGYDPWVVGPPGGSARDDHWMHVRIVDPGATKRTLVKNILNLMRPVGERFEIVYLRFLDLFDIDDDISQWTTVQGIDPVVLSGYFKMQGSGQDVQIVNEMGDAPLTNYVVTARLNGNGGHIIGGEYFGVCYYLPDDSINSGYATFLSIYSNTLSLAKFVSGSPSALVTVDLSTVGITLQDDVNYTLRTQISPESSTNRIKIYLDGELYINTTDSTYITGGKTGLIHESTVTMICDEMEVLGLPVESDTVEINY